jgi:hypothetical protein
MFEYFREGHVPECQATDDLPDIFNDPMQLDTVAPAQGDQRQEDGEQEEEPETLF